jgi:hypothetical protein
MRFHAFGQKVAAAIIYIGLLYILYPLLNMIILGMTLYAAYFIYAFDVGTGADGETFRTGATYVLLMWTDHVLAILLAVYLTWKIGGRVLKGLMRSDNPETK